MHTRNSIDIFNSSKHLNPNPLRKNNENNVQWFLISYCPGHVDKIINLYCCSPSVPRLVVCIDASKSSETSKWIEEFISKDATELLKQILRIQITCRYIWLHCTLTITEFAFNIINARCFGEQRET